NYVLLVRPGLDAEGVCIAVRIGEETIHPGLERGHVAGPVRLQHERARVRGAGRHAGYKESEKEKVRRKDRARPPMGRRRPLAETRSMMTRVATLNPRSRGPSGAARHEDPPW